MQNKGNLHTLPDAEGVRLEREHLRKKAHSSKQNILPSPEQIAAERNRLKKHSMTDEKLSQLKQVPVERQKSKKGQKRVLIPDRESVVAERERLKYQARFKKVLLSTISILLVVAAAAALIATLYLPVLQVSGTSMEPTLHDGDVIVLMKTADFDTGDLVGLYYNGKIMLKRVIGGAGDYINIDANGDVYVNGVYVDEPYVTEKSLGDCDVSFPYQIPDNTYFVLGDHRSVSTDSRNSSIGCIRTEQIIGRIFLRIWPLKDIAYINQ